MNIKIKATIIPDTLPYVFLNASGIEFILDKDILGANINAYNRAAI